MPSGGGQAELLHEPEVLAFGPRRSLAWVRWAVLIVVLAVAAPLARVAIYEVTKPPPDFTLAQLQGAYYGMVRSDGTNDMSTIDATKFTDPTVSISPDVCAPLFVSTVANRFPNDAVDGVSTYWLNEGSTSISLFTLRYPTTAAAVAAYDTVTTALARCTGTTVAFGREIPGGVTQDAPVGFGSGVRSQTAFLLERGGAGRFGFQVMQLSNTVSWQYRYDTTRSPYDQQAAQQLMDGLAAQLLFIQRDQPGVSVFGRPIGRR